MRASNSGEHHDQVLVGEESQKVSEFLSVDEVAILLRVHRSAVYQAIKRGLPAKKIGKSYRINKNEIRAWFGGSAYTRALATLNSDIATAEALKEIALKLLEISSALGHKYRDGGAS